MARIAEDLEVVTLINVFTEALEDQQRLVDLLVAAGRPGHVSANVRRSLDGTRVTNYSRWRSPDDFEAMLGDPEAVEHMREAQEIAVAYEPHHYEVVFSRGRGRPPGISFGGKSKVTPLATSSSRVAWMSSVATTRPCRDPGAWTRTRSRAR